MQPRKVNVDVLARPGSEDDFLAFDADQGRVTEDVVDNCASAQMLDQPDIGLKRHAIPESGHTYVFRPDADQDIRRLQLLYAGLCRLWQWETKTSSFDNGF